jgi:hypothetical protein
VGVFYPIGQSGELTEQIWARAKSSSDDDVGCYAGVFNVKYETPTEHISVGNA